MKLNKSTIMRGHSISRVWFQKYINLLFFNTEIKAISKEI